MNRSELNTVLKTILGTNNVYFQPPENIKINYPCIIYERDSINARFASNTLYKHNFSYSLMYVSNDPESEDILLKLASLPMCRHYRHYKYKNLNHDVFKIFI